MDNEIAGRLLALNRQFYCDFAYSFVESRSSPQPGFSRLLDYVPQTLESMVDVGCGHGRFAIFMKAFYPALHVTGVDFTSEFIAMASAAVDGRFLEREISRSGYLDGLGRFDLAVCLATLQHIPGRHSRLATVKEIVQHLNPRGRIFLSSWQFMHSERQRRKIVPWSEAGLCAEQVEEHDYLLSWRRDGHGLRYVHFLDAGEVAWLAQESSLAIVAEFRSDGREGDLNRYTVLAAAR